MLECGSIHAAMWEAIQYVSGGFTLCAFIVAAIAWGYKQKNKADLEAIKTLPEENRAQVLSEKIEVFKVNTSNLTKEQQYDVVVRQINARVERYRLLASVVVVLAIVAAGLTGYAYQITKPDQPNRKTAATSDNKTSGSATSTSTTAQEILAKTERIRQIEAATSDNKTGESATSTSATPQDILAQTERIREIAAKINEIVHRDRDAGDSNGIAGSCPVGERVDFSIVAGKIHYYSCAHACFATRDSVPVSNLDFDKMTINTIPADPTWAWVKIPCRGDQGKCVEGEMGTTRLCPQAGSHQTVWNDELDIVPRTANAQTVFDYFEDLAHPR